ncbi:Pre-mRNA-splicing factor SPF27 [Daldinia loculata]|uniref:Pre-mRNA-splicing factor SPF27 n=1 Tax=Daldinia loculata TaxID=103429 RepID=UPI0020C35CAC|nr:Pre-mRNA-splicing factor SPF27 [Daldinia loculata]KAI1642452.1 Pre-mRNA-splicing factor SPF27 [Daldinia loculata]KAI2769397.1 Pre-mRNA-splicing factor SPF27 [Daldinia loculata]
MSSSIRTTVHESLPYVDPEPTPAERAAAESLIAQEQQSSDSPSPSNLPPLPSPKFTPAITGELTRIASKQPLRAIDLTRYEASDIDLSSTSSDPSHLQTELSRAYTAATYLSGRHTHLQLLDSFGKNAWLVGNWQLEAELRDLERDLDAAKKEIDVVNIQRKRVQDEVGGELKGLDEAWRRGVGKVLETEIATEGLRQQVLERQRGSA